MTDSKQQGVDILAAKFIRSIKRIDYGCYEIELVSKTGAKLTSIARVARSGLDRHPESVTFDSDDVGKHVMQGLIYVRSVCSVVAALHRAQPESMEEAGFEG